MYSLMNPLCWSRSTLINSHEQIPLFSQCCLDKLQFHLTLDSNFNSFHRTTVNTSLGIQWLNCKARSVSQLPPRAHPASPSPLTTPTPTTTTTLYFKSQFVLSHLRSLHLKTKVTTDIFGLCCAITGIICCLCVVLFFWRRHSFVIVATHFYLILMHFYQADNLLAVWFYSIGLEKLSIGWFFSWDLLPMCRSFCR